MLESLVGSPSTGNLVKIFHCLLRQTSPNRAPRCKTLGVCRVMCPHVMHACAVNVTCLILVWFLNNAHRKPRSLYLTSMLLVMSWVMRGIAGSVHYSSWKEAIAVSFVHRVFVKKRRRPRCSENVVITFKQSVFKKFHTFPLLKSPWEA